MALNLSNLLEKPIRLDTRTDSVENNPLFHYYCDMTEITNYYLNNNQKSVVPLHVPACPWDIDIDDDSLDNS